MLSELYKFLHADAFSSFVMFTIFLVLIAAQFSSRKWVRRVALLLFVLMTYMVINAYRSLIKGLTRPTYESRKEDVVQGKYHMMHDFHAQQVTLYTEDGLQLSGYLVLRPEAKGTIIAFHGWRSTKDLMVPYVDALPEYNFFLLDFRGHGASQGSLMTLGREEINDSRAAVNFVQHYESTKNLPIYGLGVSMGGSYLIAIARQKPEAFKALIIDSSFASLDASARSDFRLRSWLPRMPFFSLFRWLMWILTRNDFSYEPAVDVRNLKIPLLIIHSVCDVRVGTDQAVKLYEAAQQASGLSQLWMPKYGTHGGICVVNGKEYGDKVREFLAKSAH